MGYVASFLSFPYFDGKIRRHVSLMPLSDLNEIRKIYPVRLHQRERGYETLVVAQITRKLHSAVGEIIRQRPSLYEQFRIC